MPRATNEKLNKSSKSKKKTNRNVVVERKTKDDKFSFDDEIVIGLKRIDEPANKLQEKATKKKKNNKKNNKKNKQTAKDNVKVKNKNIKENSFDDSNIIIKSKYMSNYENNEEDAELKNKQNKAKLNKNKKTTNKNYKNNKKKQIKSKKKRKIIFRVIKWLILLGIVIGGIVYAMLSPIFNIQGITVTGNSKISSETIVSLSGLIIDQNIFSFRTSDVIDGIKQNAYIDTVDVKRKFPDQVELSVKERVATYMLTYGNAYVYLNNQGYILEITSEKGDFPTITGYETPTEQIVEGNRLSTTDLEKLNDVLKIMEAISSGGNKIDSQITQIDITDNSNYILTLGKAKKKIYLGDTTNLSTKVLWINKFMQEEEKNEGTIYLNVDLNNDRPYFREKV